MDRDPANNGLDEHTRQDLARLAHGSLEGYARAELEARLAGSPKLRSALERQRAGAAALRGISLEAPAALRTRIAAKATAPSRPKHRRRLVLGGAVAGAL